MAAKDADKQPNTNTEPELSAEEKSRQAMGKGPVSEGGTPGAGEGFAYVPEAGGDPDSVARVVKHLPQYLQDRLGGTTPEQLAAERSSYGEEVNAMRNPQGPRATDGASDEEMARRTGQPIGDGKSTGAPSADDPGSGLREGKLTAGNDTADSGSSAAMSAAASRRAAANVAGAPTPQTQADVQGQTETPQGRTATAPSKATTAAKSTEEK